MERNGERATAVAQEFILLHLEKTGQLIDEMRLYKMMYFAQRESLILYNEALFDAKIEAWEYGPVIPNIRSKFNLVKRKQKELEAQNEHMELKQSLAILTNSKRKLSDRSRDLVHNTYIKFRDDNPMTLNARSQDEFSWIYATNRGRNNKEKNVVMDLASIRVDAINELLNRKLGE